MPTDPEALMAQPDATAPEPRHSARDAALASARRTLALEAAGLAALAAALDGALGDAFANAVATIAAARGRLIVTGMGKSGHIGRKIAATLASTGTAAHFVHPAEASHGDLGMIRAEEDMILALSGRARRPNCPTSSPMRHGSRCRWWP